MVRRLKLSHLCHPLIRYRDEKGLPISARTMKKGLSGLLIGLFLKGVICIDFAHFCRGIYNSTEGVPNQDAFVIDVFKAAGSSYSFTKKGTYSNSNYGAKLFNGGKLLSRNHRSSFPNPINTTGLAKYLSEHIKKASVRTVMNYFTIPTDADINASALTKALADQLQIIIHEPDSDADIVATSRHSISHSMMEMLSGLERHLPTGDMSLIFTSTSPTHGNYLTLVRSHGRAEGLSV